MNARSDVSVIARVIAAGVEYRNGEWKVLASISLLPVPSPDAADRAYRDLRGFPMFVERLIAERFNLRIDTIDMTSGIWRSPRRTDAVSVAVNRSFVKERQRYLEQAGKLWERIFEIDDWGVLTEALRRSREQSSLTDVQRAPKDPESPLGGESIRIPDVFSYPRSDAALLYGLERARDVLRAVGDQNSSCQVGACRINTGSRIIDPARFTFLDKPWLGMNEPLIRLAQSTVSDVRLASTGLKGDERQGHYLAMERRTQETIYRHQLEDKARAADRQAVARKAFLDAKQPYEKLSAMRQHAGVRATSFVPLACLDACSVSSDDRISEKLTDRVKSVHSFGGLPDVDEFGDPIFDPCLRTEEAWEVAVRVTGERFHAIHSMPSLARLLNLVIDVECSLTEFKFAMTDTKGVDDPGAVDHFAREIGEPFSPADRRTNYMFLTAEIGSDWNEEVQRPVWTLAKWRYKNPEKNLPGEAGHFWPCTREEVVARLNTGTSDAEKADPSYLRSLCGIFQYDGVVDLGMSACADDGMRNPRYDITSLDTINAVESDMQMDRRIENLALTPKDSQLDSVDLGVHTRRSGGLALLDRWRQDHVTSQIITALNQTPDDDALVLDAEELTSGYRLDVGLLTTKNAYRRHWRSLMHRSIEFRDPAENPKELENWMEEAIDELYGIAHPPGKGRSSDNARDYARALERRMRIDGASVATASRLKKKQCSK